MTRIDVLNETDPAVLDGLYNSRAAVPRSGEHLARWAAESGRARQTIPCRLDVPYGGTAEEKLDIFLPSNAASAILFFIHGGYWRALDKADHSFIVPAFAEAGACVVIPNYALCPLVTVPDIAQQIMRALAWTYRHADEFGGDRDRITVAGHSAGGHLAAMALTRDWRSYGSDLPATPVKNSLAISGLFDLESVMRTPYLQTSLHLTPSQVLEASPARLRPVASVAGRGVLNAVVGGDESAAFHAQNQLIQKAWGRDVVPVCESLAGLDHFTVLEALVQPGEKVHQLARDLLS